MIASESREFSGLLRHLANITTLDWKIDYSRRAILNNGPVLLLANGPGPKLAAQAAQAVKQHHHLDALASIGFCGALNPALKPCDLLVATSLIACDDLKMSQAPVAHALCLPRSHSCDRQPATLLSLDRVAHTAEEKRTLRQQTRADAIEMESAGLIPLAQEWKIPFFAIKVVTDTASESFPLDFNALRTPEGRFSRPKIIAATLRHPRAIPALINLNRRCTQAARTLGDFLADTRF